MPITRKVVETGQQLAKLGNQAVDSLKSSPHEDALTVLKQEPISTKLGGDPTKHMRWTANMVRDGKRNEAIEKMRTAGFSEAGIEASFMEGITGFDEERIFSPTYPMLKQGLADLRKTRADYSKELDKLRAQRREEFGDTPADLDKSGRIALLDEQIAGYEQELQSRADKLMSRFGEISAAVQTLEPTLFGDIGNKEYREGIDAAAQIIQFYYPDVEVSFDEDVGLITVDGEYLDHSLIDSITSNLNTNTLMIGYTAGAYAGGKAISKFAKLKPAGGSIYTLAAATAAMGVNYAFSEAEKQDRRQAAKSLGVFLSDVYETNRQYYDFVLGMAAHGVGAVGFGAYKSYKVGKEAAKKGIEKGREALTAEREGEFSILRFGSEFLKGFKESGVPMRPDTVANMQAAVGLTDEVLEKEMNHWVKSFLRSNGGTKVELNDIENKLLAKWGVKLGYKKALIPSETAFNKLTLDEKKMVYMVNTKSKALQFLVRETKNNPNLTPEFVLEGITRRTDNFKRVMDKEPSLNKEELEGLVDNIYKNTQSARGALERSASGKVIHKADYDNNPSIPIGIRNKENMSVHELVDEYHSNKYKPDQKHAIEGLIRREIPETVWKTYKNAINIADRGLVHSLKRAKTEDDYLKVFLDHANETGNSPDWQLLKATAFMSEDLEGLRKLETAIVKYVSRKAMVDVPNSPVQGVNWRAAYDQIKNIHFLTSEAEAHKYALKQFARQYDDDSVSLGIIAKAGFPTRGRGAGSGGISSNPLVRIRTMMGQEAAVAILNRIPGTKAYDRFGVENSVMRILTANPMDQKAYSEFVRLTGGELL